ncbi:hypothetical protein [Vulcanisaeta distributa]|uniref:Uncharacterized protein n=1 Tax=Vulcanisaeta distributa (strain DSM 14429 / JCM 11212 / NBRC 100878 / IC-017) TaxID=572478 RepID=E1QNT3_VULDI|nr:hypothetical protein [Vulcanisaeta distributa]ADN50179.1 hypothetical protein Vdis_0787 [Vulcanisaeta distributa DSM 14429]
MKQFVLIIMYVSSDEVQGLVSRHLANSGLSILPNVVISWLPRQDLERRLLSIKEELIDIMERGFEGEFAYAIIELTDEQFKAIRPMIVRRLESDSQRLISWGEALLKRIRSQKVERVKRELLRFDREYRRLVSMHEVFDVRHELLNKLMELARELRIEYERRSQ